jgi:membrane-bound inhibitor of C-type lysozyme
MVAVTWGDEGIVLAGTPAASGAKYGTMVAGDAPALFWSKGETAIFAPPGGPQHECLRRPVS